MVKIIISFFIFFLLASYSYAEGEYYLTLRSDKVNLVSKETAKQTLTVKQDSWEKNENYVFNIFANEDVVSLIKKIENK